WIGKRRSPWLRLASLVGVLWKFRPHIVQSAHFYTNPYATISARFLGAVPIACSRSDIVFDLRNCKGMGRWVLRTSRVLLVNSHAARRNAEGLAVKAEKIRVLPNVIDLASFDAAMSKNSLRIRQANRVIAMCVGRLISEKRVDFFLA